MNNCYNILLIESNNELVKLIIEWFQGLADVTHVADNDSALELLTSGDWQLVIKDINSNELNDLNVIQDIKQANSFTSILIIAENVKVDFILTAMKYHADGLLFKPLDKNEFISRALQLAEDAKRKKAQNTKIILAIGAHPDDVEFGCSGSLAKFRAEGNQINILTLSLGNFGGDPQIRKAEAYNAAELQGANLYVGNLADTKISNGLETINLIDSIIQKTAPTHVYTHSFHDSHQDHRCTYQATVTACRGITNLFSYLSPSSTVDFRPNTFINIDNYINKKLQIIAVHKSQMSTRPYLQPEMIVATAKYWGRFASYSLVEPMEVIKEQS